MRHALTIEDDSLIDLVIGLGFVGKLAVFLDIDSESLRLEAAWALTNIAGGKNDSVTLMRKLGIQYKMLELLRTGSLTLIDQVRLEISPSP